MNNSNELTLRLKTAESEQEKLLDELFDIKTSLTLMGEESTQKKISDELFKIKSQIVKLQTKHTENDNFFVTEGLGVTQENYVICLAFSKHSPPEWSGDKWGVSGKGQCYPTSEQAYQCLQQLKQKWPDYPIEILKK
ncbi:MAG: hypothetical protein KAG43_05435 [Candidatus Marithrix sp.]|nr:hypothetical protein [Candidatus Marithrix sp.]